MKKQYIIMGGKKWPFKLSFSKFTLSTIKGYMKIHDEVDELVELYDSKLGEMQLYVTGKEGKESEELAEVLLIDSELSDIQFQLTGKRIDMLCLLCEKESFKDFIMKTNGIDYAIIKEALRMAFEKLGHFTDYWNECPAIEQFTFMAPSSILRRTYMVHEMDKNTLYRETMANVQAQKAMNFKGKLQAGSWDHICKFVSILVRPKKQTQEFAFTKKSFINSKVMKGMSNSEKLNFYMEKCDHAWNSQEKVFKELPLNIAIGVLKAFEIKKKN